MISSKADGSAHGNRSDAGDRQRRRKNTVGGGNGGGFSGRKTGTTRSLNEFRYRKEKKFVKNAALLRGYRKAVKSEGFDAGKGASRKREDLGGDAEKKSKDERGGALGKRQRDSSREDEGGLESEVSKQSRDATKRPKKMDPFAKARAEAELRKSDQESAEVERVKRRKEEDAKLQKRKRRNKMMSKRTKTGQPVMKHIISGILEKLEKDA